VKCIYIDPPYNTGNEGWVYNDNVNSPGMRKWLGQVVGKEAEDLSRHDKWLCMMYPRLALLREFLSEDGAIFISIDDNEVHGLRMLLDEIFGSTNFIATVIWHKMDSPKNVAIHLSEDHDYIVLHARHAATWRPFRLARPEAMDARYKNPDNDSRGPWLLSDLAARNFYSLGRYPITTPSGKVIPGPPAGSFWRVSEDKFTELDADNRVWWGKSGSNRPGIKRFLSEIRDGVVPQTYWPWQDVGSTRHAKQEFSQLMGAKAGEDIFITPKPLRLLKRILDIAADSTSLILDSFAGSGTTGHAVLAANAADGGARRFILVEMEPEIATNVTAQRLSKAITGYTDPKGKEVAGLGGGFRYCTLGPALFDQYGLVNESVRFADLAHHVFFAETGSPLPKKATGRTPLIGTFGERAIYLLFNGILGDKSLQGGNVLTGAVLESLPPAPTGIETRVIYGEGTRLGENRLEREGIVFKQIPYGLAGG